jgi:hypothetical protein
MTAVNLTHLSSFVGGQLLLLGLGLQPVSGLLMELQPQGKLNVLCQRMMFISAAAEDTDLF